MKIATVTRVPSDEWQTLGILKCETFIAKTLELAWKENQNNISCIPTGEYICKYSRSNRISAQTGKDYFTYEILNVVNRGGVRIHSANYFHQLRGCIALGDKDKSIDLDKDGKSDIVHSGATIAAFEKFLNYEDFKLIIK